MLSCNSNHDTMTTAGWKTIIQFKSIIQINLVRIPQNINKILFSQILNIKKNLLNFLILKKTDFKKLKLYQSTLVSNVVY
ncbi:hypothetical protein BpHYR1_017402 [Brachionus plicatilis]|uniref:Uncharacterized protein n=1 Tax=Brachionus plicatilis TaxID=10195 RepID=A0A3M7T1U2_BRAPC|nr:hypothetical protein BpHYR1_017402 [Brachionus plicatilis]